MKKQMIQFGVIIVILVIFIGGYFGISKYFSLKEEKEEAERIVALEIKDYEKVSGISYINNGETITLGKSEGEWYNIDDSSVNLSENAIETGMLMQLAEVTASQIIDSPKDLSDYGFTENDDGNIEGSTNTIVIVDADSNTHTLYIGDANPYDSSKYYMMVEGDDNVYVVDSTVPDAFSKSLDDITEEETTVEETTVEETTVEKSES